MSLREQMMEYGYVTLEGAYSQEDILHIRMLLLEQFLCNGGFAGRVESLRSSVMPDIGNKNSRVIDIVLSEPVKAALREVIGEPVHYLHHSDIHMNWSGGWHRDSIDKPTYYDFLRTDIWRPDLWADYKVYKVALYLQDHTNNDDGFHIVPKSHQVRSAERPQEVALHTAAGDVVIFDTRLIHRGVLEKELLGGAAFPAGHNRMSIFASFGADNAMSREFALGTIWRQNQQQSAEAYALDPKLEQVLLKHEIQPLPGMVPSPQPGSTEALYTTMM